MNVGFHEKNLNAAVELLIKIAKERGISNNCVHVKGVDGSVLDYELDNEKQVREYLMHHAQTVYEQAGNSLTAQIVDMAFSSIGFMFEKNIYETDPSLVSTSADRPAHIAMFWQVL